MRLNFTEFLIIFVVNMIDRIVLFPYYFALKLREFLYDKGIKKSYEAAVPTICLGNVTAGGTGKTPHSEMILRLLLESDRWGAGNIALLSRGYKRRSKGFQQVTVEGGAKMYGDEPVQIKRKFPSVTVAVEKDRVKGCRYLADPQAFRSDRRAAKKCKDGDFPAADIIVLDDAFQYRRLRARLNIVLVDYNRPVYNDSLLPIGGLRDLPERLGDADVIIVSKCPYYMDDWEKTKFAYNLGLKDFRTSEFAGTTASGKRQKVFFTTVRYEQFKPVFEDEADNRYIYSKRLVLFTGIAKDSPLIHYLSDSYKIVSKYTFPDHHSFDASDFRLIAAGVKQYPTAAVATTEKDAQRVLDCKKIPSLLKERLFRIPIRAEFLSEAEKDAFREILATL